ncbi:uncharacterized protein LY89DRAFT_673751 [Mollisia scopiformis]|uniref:Uncharacterized protein n=1 Tax=Mollisia scopiformis TaxID=149040 RepID=A0A194WWA2_MOLSC|nr:uncharacterized protein LY89DRAFT_673751 [Mollisia scopiformis]KUJ11949.1 hypothetical protein LY89DRAFT_673751 [Mollisia scopiformis]
MAVPFILPVLTMSLLFSTCQFSLSRKSGVVKIPNSFPYIHIPNLCTPRFDPDVIGSCCRILHPQVPYMQNNNEAQVHDPLLRAQEVVPDKEDKAPEDIGERFH